jgi:hypothetical protein
MSSLEHEEDSHVFGNDTNSDVIGTDLIWAQPACRPPGDTDGARAWLQVGPRILLDAVSAIGPEEN